MACLMLPSFYLYPRRWSLQAGDCEYNTYSRLTARVQIHWSSAYDGFGTGSLDRDCDEIKALVDHVAKKDGVKIVVLAGHSTGSQDVIRFLSSDRLATSPTVVGGILISPASDREFFESHPDKLWTEQLAVAERLLREGKKDQILDDMTEPFGARVTAYRLHSLIGVG